MGATKPEKKEKKEKSSKRSEVDGVSKSSKSKDGSKKEKKEKKDKLKSAVLNAALDEQLQSDAAAQQAPEVTEIEVEEDGEKVTKHVVGALVPFALPLADEKATKKVLKSVRKGKLFQSCIPPHFPFFSLPITLSCLLSELAANAPCQDVC